MAYSDKETAALVNAAEEHGAITFAMAEELASELGYSPRSIIAKVKSLDLPYEPKPKPEKREKGLTKAELVAQVAENLGVEPDALAGLTKATAAALGRLVEAT